MEHEGDGDTSCNFCNITDADYVDDPALLANSSA